MLEISEQLLKAQINILQPDVIIFANGASSARFRQGIFPIRANRVYVASWVTSASRGFRLTNCGDSIYTSAFNAFESSTLAASAHRLVQYVVFCWSSYALVVKAGELY